MTHTAPLFPPTANPCPPWCTQPAGHGYDSVTRDGGLARGHSADFGHLELPDDDNTVSTAGRPGEVWVSICSGEFATDDTSAPTCVEPAKVVLYSEGAAMTVQQAFDVAAMLTAAAERLEALERADLPCSAWDSCPNHPRAERGRR